MKLVAHSLVPPNPVPYLHLGYLSAAPMTNAMPFLGFTVVMLFIAVTNGKRNPLVRYISLALMCIGIAGVFWGCKQGAKVLEQAKVKSTGATVHVVKAELDMLDRELGTLPPDLSVLGKQYGFDATDAWSRPFRLVREGNGKQLRYEIRSDGPDKTPGTKDDLTWPYKPKILDQQRRKGSS